MMESAAHAGLATVLIANDRKKLSGISLSLISSLRVVVNSAPAFYHPRSDKMLPNNLVTLPTSKLLPE
jgi:uncharacterized membrane protein (UPF0136 family)